MTVPVLARRRPRAWMPNEPLVVVMPETEDGSCEVNLEMAGEIVATRVVVNDRSMGCMIAAFNGVVAEQLARYCHKCGATMCECRLCGQRWCLDHQPNPLRCPRCGKYPREGS